MAEYLIDLNATQAAIRAGYSEKYAGQNADKLIKNTNIAAAIQSRRAAVSEKLLFKGVPGVMGKLTLTESAVLEVQSAGS